MKNSSSRLTTGHSIGETVVHGEPDGIDNAECARGYAVLLKENLTRLPSVVEQLTSFTDQLRLLIVDTKQPRFTAALVDKVRRAKDAHPERVEHILDCNGQMVMSLLGIFLILYMSVSSISSRFYRWRPSES